MLILFVLCIVETRAGSVFRSAYGIVSILPQQPLDYVKEYTMEPIMPSLEYRPVINKGPPTVAIHNYI